MQPWLQFVLIFFFPSAVLGQEMEGQTDGVIPPTFKTAEVSVTSHSRIALPLGVRMAGADKLHSDGLTGKGVRVGVIDTGIDADHLGFHGMVKHRKWYRQGPLKKHGTHVAGTIHMLAPEAEIFDYRIFGTEGEISTDDALSIAIRHAVDDGCDVINMSLGMDFPDPIVGEAIAYAYENGVLMIVAAGNDGDGDVLTNEMKWPAMRPEVISIAAVKKESNLPVAYFSNSNNEVDYAHVGFDILSFKAGGGLQTMDGTSMAAPHVCGLVAALMTEGGIYSRYIKDDASLRFVLNAYFLTDIGLTGPDNSTGLGFLSYLNEEESYALWREVHP